LLFDLATRTDTPDTWQFSQALLYFFFPSENLSYGLKWRSGGEHVFFRV
jgi:hypothetical protein